MWRLLNLGLHAVTIGLLIWVLREQRQLAKKGDKAMADQFDELDSKVEAVVTAHADMEQRIDAIIDALKMPNDDPRVGAMIAKLEALRTRQQDFSGDLPDNPPVDPPVEPAPTDPGDPES